MKLLFDTTYFLPAIGISVRRVPKNVIPEIRRRREHVIMLSSITIFELAAKGAKLVAAGKLSRSRVDAGLRAIAYDDRIERVDFQDLEILERALTLRKEIGDFIDCLILASAASRADLLVTEDGELQKLASEEHVTANLVPENPDFRVASFKVIA